MLNIKDTVVDLGNGMSRFRKESVYTDDEILNKKAIKKQAVLDVATIGTQLNAIAVLLVQIGDSVFLETDEFIATKKLFADIKVELDK